MDQDPKLVERLKGVDLFATLSDRDLKRVVESGRLVTHAAGKEAVTEGGGSAGFHLVLEGAAIVDVAGSSRPPLGPGEYFGEIALLDGKPRSATVTAGPDGLTTFSLVSFDFWNLLEKHPEMNRPIIEVLCGRIRAERERQSATHS